MASETFGTLTPPSQEAVIEYSSFHGKTLIFIDNNPRVVKDAEEIVREEWEEYFETTRFLVHGHDTMSEVQDLIDACGPENCIVLCDLNMKITKGDKLLLALRHYFGWEIILILYTAHPDLVTFNRLKRERILYRAEKEIDETLIWLAELLTKGIGGIMMELDKYVIKPTMLESHKKHSADISQPTINESGSQEIVQDKSSEEGQFLSYEVEQTISEEALIKKPTNPEEINNVIDSYRTIANFYLAGMTRDLKKYPDLEIVFYDGSPPMKGEEFLQEIKDLTPLAQKYMEKWVNGINKYRR